MKQVFLSGQGQIEVIDTPVPGRITNGLLIRNAYSLISTGTEGAAVTLHSGARGLYEKVLKSRDRLDQVWSMVHSQGLTNTMALIHNKLEDYTPIGYSCAGQLLEVDNDDLGFKPGQRVACIGTGFANHAEFVVIPKNLAAALPDNVSYEEAAFAAIACIAMQGVRRLELSPGETVAVVGLGLIGQIALRLASAMGYRTYGVDIDTERVDHATLHGKACKIFDSRQQNVVTALHQETAGYGVDGVIICASAKVDEIINQAFDMCRSRGRVSVVGDIGLSLQRAKMYAKELEVRLSCSYGVGRYDPEYELHGIDYPLPHVRWTEQRNLEFFLQLLAEKHLDLSDLISTRVEIGNAKHAYALIKSSDTSTYGVLLDYALPTKPMLPKQAYMTRYETTIPTSNSNALKIGLIGIGAYAKNTHLPNLMHNKHVVIRAIASKSGSSAAIAAKKAKAEYATSDIAHIMADGEIDAVVISTRHASHARFVLDALHADKHVFIEKPMAINIADCLRIIETQKATGKIVRVGYNRRFAPMLKEMNRIVGEGCKLFNIRVNTGNVDQHWSNTTEEGGRLLGEGAHFFDLATWMMDSIPVAVTAQFLGESSPLNLDASISIRYENGSVANITYVTVGHTARGKEFFEVFGNGRSVMVDNYKKIEAHGARTSIGRSARNNKGQAMAMVEFVDTVRTANSRHGADAQAGLWATVIALAAIRSAQQAKTICLEKFVNNPE